MYATDNGLPITVYEVPRTQADGKDIRLLPLMVKAARTAESEDYCYQYDTIAEAIGTWTRDELREAGMLDTDYSVSGYRRVTVTMTIPFSYTGSFSSREDAEQSDPDDFDELTDSDVQEYMRYNSFDVEVDDTTIDSVDRD